MRALRVVGLDDDGTSVICEDPVRGERYTIPCDERLRAAARGDVARLGQIAAENDVQMRPREIQARIRAGESVDQVAAAAGLPTHRIERYAYPVLLERSRTAELAQRAHPIREDGPDVQTLGEVIAHSFGLRGQDYSSGHWDSWRGEDGKWIIQLHWQAGRSENRAHWTFHPGAHGGTVSPIDDHAIDLLDPSPNRPLRTVRPVTELARQALELEHQTAAHTPVQPQAQATPAPAPVVPAPVVPAPVAPEQPEPPAARKAEPQPAPAPEPETARVEPPQPAPAPAINDPEPVEEPPAAQAPQQPVAQPPVPQQPTAQPEAQPAARKAEAPPRRGKKNHPIVPSWEDVLLGVRSQR